MELCDLCHKASRRTIPAYWGQNLCPHCAHIAAELHDIKHSWPDEPWARPKATAQPQRHS